MTKKPEKLYAVFIVSRWSEIPIERSGERKEKKTIFENPSQSNITVLYHIIDHRYLRYDIDSSQSAPQAPGRYILVIDRWLN